jgi:lipopolysaccharide/colanic/teichoic acid biosynthesis glycosyltransferase
VSPYAVLKRVSDVVASLVLLAIASPVLLPVMVILKFTGEGDIWYFQRRIGYRNRDFYIWKFATMLRDSPNLLTGSLTLRNDPRVTVAGKYLRATKLNELPQIINVLKGEMSLVGPRPQMEVDFLAYPESVRYKIYEVKPGITGIGSIVFRDEEKIISVADDDPRSVYDQVIAPYKGALELWYQQHYSFGVDLKILLLTLAVVFAPRLRVVRYFSGLPPVPPALIPYIG